VHVQHLVATYGYWAVLVAVTVECLGVPLPGEATLVAAGAYAGTTHKLDPWLIFVFASAGTIIGGTTGYWIGVKGGYPLLRRYGRYIKVNEAEMKVGRYVFDRRGGLVVLVGRFVAILRIFAPFLAGTNKMRWHRFMLFNSLGGVAWSAVWAFASYFAGDSLRHTSTVVDFVLGGLAVVAIVAVIALSRHHGKRLEARAEAAYPGPLTD
jgi:membrane protein DedA with SNARE-associated domain